jgi:hypothetical protein
LNQINKTNQTDQPTDLNQPGFLYNPFGGGVSHLIGIVDGTESGDSAPCWKGLGGVETSSARALLRTSTEISSGSINMLSATSPKEAIAGVASRSESGAYSQVAFRQLLESESKRSERSGHFWQILLVYLVDAQGRIVQMSSDVAQKAIAASFRSFRETDYVGWYRDGHIVGAVLTVLAKESMTQVSASLQSRLEEILRSEIGVEGSNHMQIRVCQPHELNGFESGG